ncbi:MAG TPA: hypothetical protein VKZ53_31625 [Candidatus Angelobacter sp.]|nr:hypothetical protein [Candidatus Angelobacter sp.]
MAKRAALGRPVERSGTENTHDKEHGAVSTGAFQVWMGQWRLAKLDAPGCVFVLRYVLGAFRARKVEDAFWKTMKLFFESAGGVGLERTGGLQKDLSTTKELLARASVLAPDQAHALLDHLSQSYELTGDRLFWRTVSDAIQLYAVAPPTYW